MTMIYEGPIVLRHGLKATFETNNPSLKYGEIAIAFDGATPRVKIGNPTEEAFNSLPWFGESGGGSMAIGGDVTSGTPGSILFVNASNQLAQNNAGLFWDNSNRRIGVNITPGAVAHFKSVLISDTVQINQGVSGQQAPLLQFRDYTGLSKSLFDKEGRLVLGDGFLTPIGSAKISIWANGTSFAISDGSTGVYWSNSHQQNTKNFEYYGSSLVWGKVYASLNKFEIQASTSEGARWCWKDGAAPSAPGDGDFWRIGDTLYLRHGSTTKQIVFT